MPTAHVSAGSERQINCVVVDCGEHYRAFKAFRPNTFLPLQGSDDIRAKVCSAGKAVRVLTEAIIYPPQTQYAVGRVGRRSGTFCSIRPLRLKKKTTVCFPKPSSTQDCLLLPTNNGVCYNRSRGHTYVRCRNERPLRRTQGHIRETAAREMIKPSGVNPEETIRMAMTL